MSGMAEVLAAHAPNGVSGYGFEYVLCTCDRTNWMKAHEFPEHQLSALTAAGFGPVKEAGAAAWEEGHNHCFHVEDPRNPDRNPYRA